MYSDQDQSKVGYRQPSYVSDTLDTLQRMHDMLAKLDVRDRRAVLSFLAEYYGG